MPITILLPLIAAVAVAVVPALAQERHADPERPEALEPNVQRQIDQLERRDAVDPATRRQLRDQLRRAPEGAARSSAERRLERLPETAPSADRRAPDGTEPGGPTADGPVSDPLPTSRRPGFGSSGGGGPGTTGHMVPPGGRSGGIR